MGAPIRHVTIVGGGTAGWMTAFLLMSVGRVDGRDTSKIKFSLIESPDVPTVGVGEATVPGMPRTLREAGISEQEFFKQCNASFKLGVYFDNWNRDKDGKPIGFVNPFARGPTINGVDTALYFWKYGAGELDFTQVISPAVDLARNFKGPRPLGVAEYDQTVGFAYHLDAGRFAGLLKDICVKRGVAHIRENVVDVEKDDRGYIAALQLKDTGRHAVELVIDCTGFRGLIINQALEEPFLDYSEYLANDKAMAVQIPHTDPDKLEPLTRSTALGAGWAWRVPLYNRVGTGYVYSSAHRTDDEAREEFLAHLGDAGKAAEPRIIPMRVGRTRRAWVKNCVAIGLSGGFIEPLESTAIHMIDMGVRWLATYFPDLNFADPVRNRYNKLTDKLYNEVRDFICLHYALNNRTDSQYWIDVREELALPDSLAENMELWKHNLPGPFDLEFSSLFTPWVYQAVLMGKRVHETGFSSSSPSNDIGLDPEKWRNYLTHSRGRIKQIVGATADHRDLLNQIRGETEPAEKPVPRKSPASGGQTAPVATVQIPGQNVTITAKIDFGKILKQEKKEDGAPDLGLF